MKPFYSRNRVLPVQGSKFRVEPHGARHRERPRQPATCNPQPPPERSTRRLRLCRAEPLVPFCGQKNFVGLRRFGGIVVRTPSASRRGRICFPPSGRRLLFLLRVWCFFAASSYATKRHRMHKNKSRTLVDLDLLRPSALFGGQRALPFLAIRRHKMLKNDFM